MFGFLEPEDGSEDRYAFRTRYPLPATTRAIRHAWWIIHNAVAHPLIGFVPVGPLFRFHDWTSRKMHGR